MSKTAACAGAIARDREIERIAGRVRAKEKERKEEGRAKRTTEGHLETDGTNLLGKLMH